MSATVTDPIPTTNKDAVRSSFNRREKMALVGGAVFAVVLAGITLTTVTTEVGDRQVLGVRPGTFANQPLRASHIGP